MLIFPPDAHTGDKDAVGHDDLNDNFEIVVKTFPPHRNRHGVVEERGSAKYDREEKLNRQLLAEAQRAFNGGYWDDMVVGETRQLTDRATIKRIR